MDIEDLDKPRKEIERAIETNDQPKLLRMSGLLHGHYCPGLVMGVKAAARAMTELGVSSTGMEEVVAIVEINNCFSDGVQFVTGCSFGNNALIYHDFGKIALTLAKRKGAAIRVAAKANRVPLKDRYPEVAALFDKVVTKRKGTLRDDKKLRHLWIEAAFKMLDLRDEELFTISKPKVSVPEYAGRFASVVCSVCGENIMEPRARVKGGKDICLPCSGQAYHRLTGNGISVVN